MSITFKEVSYTYIDPKTRKRNAQRKHGADFERAKWGNEPEAVWALSDISFTLCDGEFLGIAGHTGSGKSTLIQHMNGLVQPTQGCVLFDDLDLSNKKHASLVRGLCGLVFQYPEHQLFATTVFEDVAFGPRNLDVAEEKLEERVRSALVQVGLDLDQLRDTSPFELSGGQQRRVALAGVLAMEPKVLVLDEPAAGLDPKARADFLHLVKSLHASGMTVVMVSHNMDDLAALADRILVLSRGRQLMLGTPEEVFADPAMLKNVGLGVPAAQTLAHRLRELAFDLPQVLYGTEQLADDLAAFLSKDTQDEMTHFLQSAQTTGEAS